MRGYDRTAVDTEIASIRRSLEQTRQQLDEVDGKAMQLSAELAEAHRQLREAERPTYSGLGSRIEQLMRSAEQQSGEVVSQANARAADALARARLAAGQLRARAENEVAEILANAQREAEEVRSTAQAEASTHLTTSQRRAEELVSSAEREADRIQSTVDRKSVNAAPAWSANRPRCAAPPNGRPPDRGAPP